MKQYRMNIATFCALVFLLTACIQNTPYPTEVKEELPAMPLADRLKNTELGGTINLESDITELSESESVSVPRSMTITGAEENPYDMKGIKIIVNYRGTVLKNLKNVSELVIAETVKDGSFTMENCQVAKVTLLGGGSNSIHFLSSMIQRLIVDYADVRVMLEKESKVTFMRVRKNCSIGASEDVYGTVSTMYVDKTVSVVTLSECMAITSVLTRSVSGENSRPLIACKDTAPLISEGADRDDNGNVTPLRVQNALAEEVAQDEIDLLSENAVSDIIAELENGSSAESSGDSTGDIRIDNPGAITLRSTRSAITVKMTVPDPANHVNIYRAEYGSENWYYVGSVETASGRPLPATLAFNDYYVVGGKSYSYYADFISDFANYSILKTETDSITAAGGEGLLEITNKITVSSSGNMKLWLDKEPELTKVVNGDLVSQSVAAYFKPATDKVTSTIVASSRYGSVQFEDRESKIWRCISRSHLGKPMNVVAIKVNVVQSVKDMKYIWASLPKAVETGDGFTGGMIAAFPNDYPLFVSDAIQGISLKLRLGNAVDASLVQQIEVQVNRRNSQEFVTILPLTDTAAFLSDTELQFKESHVAEGQNIQVKAVCKTYDEDTQLYTSIAQFSMNYTPKTGSGNPEISNAFAFTYDDEAQQILVAADSDEWFTQADIFSDTFDFVVNGETVSLEPDSLCPELVFTDESYSFKRICSLSPVTLDDERIYRLDMLSSLNAYAGQSLSIAGMQTRATCSNENYRVHYIPFALPTTLVSNLPKTFVVNAVETD